MMASNGDGFLDYTYPGLDTWRKGEKGYVHNTSGATSAKLSKSRRYETPGFDETASEAEGQGAGEGPSRSATTAVESHVLDDEGLF